MELSEKIRILRKIKGWSQEELGYKLSKTCANGISRQAVSDWENGKSEPKLDNIRDLANVLGVSFDVLLDKNIDLNDNDTLNNALLKEDKENTNDVKACVSYNIVASSFDAKRLMRLIIRSVVFAGVLAAIITSVYINNTILFLVGLVLLPISLILFFGEIISLIIEAIKKNGVVVANLNQQTLIIYRYGKDKATLYIPLETIEEMSAEGNHLNFRGTVIVKFKNKTAVLKKVYHPRKVVKAYQYVREHYGDKASENKQ